MRGNGQRARNIFLVAVAGALAASLTLLVPTAASDVPDPADEVPAFKDSASILGDPTQPKGTHRGDPEVPGEAGTHRPPGKGEPIAGRYIIVFKPGTPGARDLARDLTREHEGKLIYAYESAIQGFAANLREEKLDGLRRNPNILFIEPDRAVVVEDTQSNATWGLDRIDQRALPLSTSYSYSTTATGVHAYVIDTGIKLTHQEFTGRMGNGYDAVTSGGNANDCNGHGTHVAGTIGGTTYGVAKRVTLHSVRVLSCSGSGSTSGVIAGIDWVAHNHVKPAVANMSLGGGASQALDSAVENTVSRGVTVAVAAGNDNANACNYSPARTPVALTVGATVSSDVRSNWSNYGTCLDLFAPGSSITSAWHTSDTATNTISGTSMSAPHVAGVAALAAADSPSATPAQIAEAITSSATSGVVTSAGSGSPNRLLYRAPSVSPSPSPSPSPTPSPSPSPTSTPVKQVLGNPGFEFGNVVWTSTPYVIDGTASNAHSGTWKAWLNGYGYDTTDYVRQKVAVPKGAKLTYWLKVQTTETTATTAYDTMRVRVLDGDFGTLLATVKSHSNLNAGGWVQHSADLSAYAGKSVWVDFLGQEDYSLATSFFVDDTALTGT